MNRFVFAACLLPLTLIACAADTTAPLEGEGAVVVKPNEVEGTEIKPSRVSFCLPGEVRVCTLGPPPVCHCALPSSLPVFKQ